MAAASAMFAERGFHGVSIDDLGAELGVSGPALYRYFESKDAILSEMLVDISERLLAGARECASSGLSPRGTLQRLIECHVAFALTEPNLIAVQFRDLGNVPEPGQRTVRRLQREYVEVWVDVTSAVYPEVSRDRAAACAQAVFGLLNSTPHSAMAGAGDMERLLQKMASAALAQGCRVE